MTRLSGHARTMLGSNVLAFCFFVKGMWCEGLTAQLFTLAIGAVLYVVDSYLGPGRNG